MEQSTQTPVHISWVLPAFHQARVLKVITLLIKTFPAHFHIKLILSWSTQPCRHLTHRSGPSHANKNNGYASALFYINVVVGNDCTKPMKDSSMNMVRTRWREEGGASFLYTFKKCETSKRQRQTNVKSHFVYLADVILRVGISHWSYVSNAFQQTFTSHWEWDKLPGMSPPPPFSRNSTVFCAWGYVVCIIKDS